MLNRYFLMEEMSLKNIKIIIIAIVVLIAVVVVFRLQILGTTLEKKYQNNNKPKISQQTKSQKSEETLEADEEYIEKDDDTKNNEEKSNNIPKEALNKQNNFSSSSFEIENKHKEDIENYDRYDNYDRYIKKNYDDDYDDDKPTKTTSSAKKPVEYEQIPIKPKTAKENFNYALSEMQKGNTNSAIYEFNNTIDISTDSNLTRKAKKYLAQCYEKKGIYSEAFDIYEAIYLDTNSKNDLLEMNRIAKKANRTNTVYSYAQSYIEQHPEEEDLMRYFY